MRADVSVDRLRAWWACGQGLEGSLSGASPAEVLTRTGWARSVGGSNPYLSLFARAGLDRKTVDDAMARLEVHELPSARGCTYVLPAADFVLGLTVGSGAPDADIAAAEKHLGVTRAEIDELCAAVVEVLDTEEARQPAEIRKAAGAAVRDLGEQGRKRGQSSTLPMALGLLQAQGRIRRVPVNGRLDQQRFGYVRWSPSPLPARPDVGAARVELARRYFSWAGPASLKHFRWFSGLSASAAKQAIAPLDLVPLDGTDLLLLPEQCERFAAFSVPERLGYALVSGIDGIHLLHRDLARLLDPVDAQRPQPGARPGRTLGDDADPQTQIIVDRGRIVGLWEYDPDRGEIVHQLFVAADDAVRAAIERTETFIRDQLGDARSFSLDSPKSRAPRLAALRSG